LAALGGVVSALEAVVADGERILFRHAAGFRLGGERLVAGSGARFDAASLTKPWMATLALALDSIPEEEKERIQLRERLAVTASVVGSGGAVRQGVLEDLLRHRSGMRAWTPLALRLGKALGDRGRLRDALLAERSGPAGVYSDLGYILWGLLAEERTALSLPSLLDAHVCSPVGIASLGAIAASAEVANAVECRLDNGKEVELAAEQGIRMAPQRSFRRGVVQDGNARALRAVGIFPAHAGLFVTADEMLSLAREWLRPARLLTPARVEAALAGEGTYALGWTRWSESGSAGPALSPRSYGHTGFTGGSVWIDPEASRVYLLLSHRLSSSLDFNPFRREFHQRAEQSF
ncbi:MAG TPA: serine hydrolase domain-containing protein, partial [Thermoanaerobaculia bacterium]|nr:serine hydrolase domain-containing protein [Thermoanaerobaculia bacterium]